VINTLAIGDLSDHMKGK
ncbi:hypothetical protein KIPB_005729, partial [Kipferlia bialata]